MLTGTKSMHGLAFMLEKEDSREFVKWECRKPFVLHRNALDKKKLHVFGLFEVSTSHLKIKIHEQIHQLSIVHTDFAAVICEDGFLVPSHSFA